MDNGDAIKMMVDIKPNLVNGAGLVASAFRAEMDPFGQWIVEFGLSGSNALHNANPDGDALDNLMEYALGGNPTNDDAAAVSPGTYMVDESGTNWFYHVHNQNTDPALTFTVGATTNLVTTAVDINDVEWVGATAETNGFKTVTNRTEAVEDAKFISLSVER